MVKSKYKFWDVSLKLKHIMKFVTFSLLYCLLFLRFLFSSCYWKWGLALSHSKAIKEARLVEEKICFILDASHQRGWGEVDSSSKAEEPPTASVEEFYRQRKGLQHSQLWLSSWNWSSVISIVSGSQFQNQFVCISLRLIIRIVVALWWL